MRMSHSRATPSAPPVARVRPSRLKATAREPSGVTVGDAEGLAGGR
ncbi:hypothetical protein OHA25_37340 [Nonomuraea sp. NBC_00507]